MVNPTLPLHLSQAIASAYAGYYAYLSITRTQTYEESTKKAAKLLTVAEEHLWKTRYTLGGGAVGLVCSLTASLALLNFAHESWKRGLLVSLVLGGALAGSHAHISDYWRSSIKIPAPGMQDYNDAISSTNRLRKLIGYIAITWWFAAIWYGMKGIDQNVDFMGEMHDAVHHGEL